MLARRDFLIMTGVAMTDALIGAQMQMSERAPVIFCGHGSPMNIVENNDYTSMLKKLSESLKKPTAAVVISAHWQCGGFYVTASDKLQTIYDFYGFPKELYEYKYDSKGDGRLAVELHKKLQVKLDFSRGLDHGAWSVLSKIFPKNNVPILQISLNKNMNYYEHFRLGESLKSLRDENIMIICSGNLTHNLYEAKHSSNTTDEWAKACENDLLEKIANYDIESLLNPEDSIINFQKAHPTVEHYMPLVVALGCLDKSEQISILKPKIQNGNISMSGFITW